MSTDQKKIESAMKKNKIEREKLGKEIIGKLENNPDALEDVVRWMMKHGHHKMLKVCKVNMADDCEGVGRSSGFHGRRCRACSRHYDRIRRRSIRLKSGKSCRKLSKRSKDESYDESSESESESESECEKPKMRKRIYFKKGTKL